jgi:hypothetical protein
MSSKAVIDPRWGANAIRVNASFDPAFRGVGKLDQAYTEIQLTLPELTLRFIFLREQTAVLFRLHHLLHPNC